MYLHAINALGKYGLLGMGERPTGQQSGTAERVVQSLLFIARPKKYSDFRPICCSIGPMGCAVFSRAISMEFNLIRINIIFNNHPKLFTNTVVLTRENPVGKSFVQLVVIMGQLCVCRIFTMRTRHIYMPIWLCVCRLSVRQYSTCCWPNRQVWDHPSGLALWLRFCRKSVGKLVFN